MFSSCPSTPCCDFLPDRFTQFHHFLKSAVSFRNQMCTYPHFSQCCMVLKSSINSFSLYFPIRLRFPQRGQVHDFGRLSFTKMVSSMFLILPPHPNISIAKSAFTPAFCSNKSARYGTPKRFANHVRYSAWSFKLPPDVSQSI